jgi:hypothetical protein
LIFLAVLVAAVTSPLWWGGGSLGNMYDADRYVAPYRAFAAWRLQGGGLPLWNPLLFNGMPFLASPQTALFYPGSLVFYFLPLGPALILFTIGHLFLNAAALFLFLRGVGRSAAAARWAAAAWGLSLFFLGKVAAGHVVLLSGYAWFPLLALFAVQAARGRRSAGVGYVLASGLAFFSGHLQVWGHGQLLALVVFLAAGGLRCSWRRVVPALAVLGLWVAVQALPTASLLRGSTRRGLGPDESYRFATSYSADWRTLVRGAATPRSFDGAADQVPTDPPSDFFEKECHYVGVMPTVFGLVGLLWAAARRRWWPLGLAAGAFLLSLGAHGPLPDVLWRWLSFQRVPPRFYVGVLLALVWGAALVWDRAGRFRGLRALVFVATLVDLGFHSRGYLWGAPELRSRPSVLLRTLAGQRRPSLAGPVTESRVFTRSEVGDLNKTMFFGLPNGNGFEAVVPGDIVRLYGATQPSLVLNTTGVDAPDPARPAFRAQAVGVLIGSSAPLPWRRRDGPFPSWEDPTSLPSLRLLSAVVRVGDASTLWGFLASPAYRPDLHWVGRGGEPGVARLTADPPGEARLASASRSSAERLRVSVVADGPCWLRWAESSSPGWAAWRGGGASLAVETADGAAQAVRVTGSETVFLRYRPAAFLAGLVLTLGFLVAASSAGLRRARRAVMV